MTLDEEYHHLHPHAFHLQLPRHHKTEGGIPYATIDAYRKARAIIQLSKSLVLKDVFFVNDVNEDTEYDDAFAVVGNEEEKVEGGVLVPDSLIVDDDEEVMDDEDVHQEATSLHQYYLSNVNVYILN
jgi:hypothetical protein